MSFYIAIRQMTTTPCALRYSTCNMVDVHRLREADNMRRNPGQCSAMPVDLHQRTELT